MEPRSPGYPSGYPRIPHPDRLSPSDPAYDVILWAHEDAIESGQPGYEDPVTGMFVMTAAELYRRSWCCDHGCRHCPYVPRPPQQSRAPAERRVSPWNQRPVPRPRPVAAPTGARRPWARAGGPPSG